MTRTEWVINVLEDSFKAEIDIRNKQWLQENVEQLCIGICVEDCIVNTFDIAKSWGKKKTMLIQEGNFIHFRSDFNPLKEALLITKYFNPPYIIYLYSPKLFENK